MSCIPVPPEYLIKKSWTYEMLAEEVGKLDHEEALDYEFSVERATKSIASPLRKWFFLYDQERNKIAGFLDYRALSDEYLIKVINGTFKDGELSKGAVPFEKEVSLYIGGFVIGKAYRKDSSNFKKLLAVFIESLTQLLGNGIVLKEIVARGLSPLGQKLCEGLGMTKITPHKDKGIIYGVSFEWNEKPKHASALYNAIQKTKAKRLLQQLMGLGAKKGMPIVKDALSSWGYRTEEN
jgi:hypothetical protein